MCRVSNGEKKSPKTVHIFMGFFLMVNFCLGTGFLGIPFSFFYAGYPASILTLTLISFISWNNATWEVETMGRAQVCVCVCVCVCSSCKDLGVSCY